MPLYERMMAPRRTVSEAENDRGRDAVALACGCFESFAIHNRHEASTIGDETGSLESGRDVADRRTRDPQHHGDEFLREGKRIGE